MSTGPASPSVTPSGQRAAGSWRTCCARWTGGRSATGWRPCAWAAAKASPQSSSGSAEMRILYLSMSREEYSPNYFPFLRSYLDEIKSADTEVDLRGTRVGRIDSFRFFETLDWISILDSVIEAELEGYDAVAIGNILDPALREARSMVDIPVLGLGETSMLTSCMMGSTFSLVGVNPYFGGRFEENVAKYGLRNRLASIECMGLTPHELDACFSDPDQ